MAKEKFEIYIYAHYALANKLTSRKILLHLHKHEIEYNQFFIAYTFFKTGQVTQNNYIDTVNEFLKKYNKEMESRNIYRFWFPEDEANQSTENGLDDENTLKLI